MFIFSGREWTPESGLVTAAFKIRRRNVYDEYKEEIAQMYSSWAEGGESPLQKQRINCTGVMGVNAELLSWASQHARYRVLHR